MRENESVLKLLKAWVFREIYEEWVALGVFEPESYLLCLYPISYNRS